MALTSTVRFGSQPVSNAKQYRISHWLSQIRLSNFRNYQELAITIDKAPVVLVGKNGTGKTKHLCARDLIMRQHHQVIIWVAYLIYLIATGHEPE